MKILKTIVEKKLLPSWFLRFCSDILLFLAQNLPTPKLRILLCKLRGAKLHKVKYIGMNCLIGNHPWLLTVKENTVIASGTRILTEDDSYQNFGCEKYQEEVIIEENVHIGMNCIILPGVKIGKNSIIGAGSVVMKSIPENSIAIGYPAKVVMSTEMGKMIMEKKIKILKSKKD